MKTVVALPGQGIGVEVVDATCEILAAAGMPLKILTPPQTTGSAPDAPVPDETKRACREADAVLFGAAGSATTAVVAWLRWEMEAWGGVRPSKFYTVHEKFEVVNGQLEIPDRPGLGITVDEDFVRRYARE